MPLYTFIGDFETVLHGLSHEVNALLHRDGHGQPAESTVVAQPGDRIETDEPYPHALMINAETNLPDLPEAAADQPSEPPAVEHEQPGTDSQTDGDNASQAATDPDPDGQQSGAPTTSEGQ